MLKKQYPKIKALVFKLILVIIGLGIGLGVAYSSSLIYKKLFAPRKLSEPADFALIREKLDYNTNSIFMFHPEIQYVLKTNHTGIRYRSKNFVHRTNSRGFLGTKEFSTNPNVKKILFLGDSVLYGDGVKFDDSMTSIIQTVAGTNFQIMTAACSGWSTHQELLFFDIFLKNIEWDTVVIIVCLNDILKFQVVVTSKTDTGLDFSEEWKLNGGTFGVANTVQSLKLKKIRYNFSKNKATQYLSKEDNGILSAWLPEKWETYFNSTFRPFIKKHPDLKLVVAVAPTVTQLISLRSGASCEKVLYPQLQLKKFCDKNSILFIDISKAFESKNHDLKKCYLFPNTFHFDKLGNKIVSEFIWTNLINNL